MSSFGLSQDLKRCFPVTLESCKRIHLLRLHCFLQQVQWFGSFDALSLVCLDTCYAWCSQGRHGTSCLSLALLIEKCSGVSPCVNGLLQYGMLNGDLYNEFTCSYLTEKLEDLCVSANIGQGEWSGLVTLFTGDIALVFSLRDVSGTCFGLYVVYYSIGANITDMIWIWGTHARLVILFRIGLTSSPPASKKKVKVA